MKILKNKFNQSLKKVSLLLLFTIGFYSCSPDVISTETQSTEEKLLPTKVSDNNDITFLMSQENFFITFLETLKTIEETQYEICNNIDISSLNHQSDYLDFNDNISLKNFYDAIELSNRNFQDFFENKIDFLVSVAQQIDTISSFYNTDEEEIMNGIEELLWHFNMYDYNIQKCISDAMPIQTLWQEVKTLSDNWLANNQNNTDIYLNEDPSNLYEEDEILQLLLNTDSQIQIANEIETFALNDSKTNQPYGTCLLFRQKETTVNSSSKKIRVTLKTKSILFPKVKSKIEGWKRRNGQWKRRRFTKTLHMQGRVYHGNSASGNTCPSNLFLEVYIGITVTKRKKTFRITRSAGDIGFVGAYPYQLQATGFRGSLTTTTTLY